MYKNSNILNPSLKFYGHGIEKLYYKSTGYDVINGKNLEKTLTSADCIQSDPTTSGASPDN